MPMNWNAESEAKLMTAIFQVCQIKPTGSQLAEVAGIMGSECTAKAIMHRLGKIRAKAGDYDEGTPKKAAGEEKATPKKRKGRKAKGEEGDDDEEYGQAPTSGRKKLKMEREVEGEGDADGIKVGEDVGEGLRSLVEDDDEV